MVECGALKQTKNVKKVTTNMKSTKIKNEEVINEVRPEHSKELNIMYVCIQRFPTN